MKTKYFNEKVLKETFLQYRAGQIYRLTIDNIEKILIEKALERSYGNQIEAAKFLGINRNTLRSKIQKLSINKEIFKR